LKREKFNKEVEKLFTVSNKITDKIFSLEQIKDLPEPVQRYFRYALTDQCSYISFVRLKHKGELKVNNKWSKIKGEEYFTTETPGFLWRGKLPLFTGSDRYIEGQGNLQIRLFSLIKIVDEKGAELNQGELLRWLSETPWYPTALLPSDNLRWEETDENSAKVIFTDNEIEVEGIFHFNSKGQATKFEAKRYKDKELEDWIGYYYDYQMVDRVRVPFYVEVGWNLEAGYDKYVKFQVNKLQYEIPYKF